MYGFPKNAFDNWLTNDWRDDHQFIAFAEKHDEECELFDDDKGECPHDVARLYDEMVSEYETDLAQSQADWMAEEGY